MLNKLQDFLIKENLSLEKLDSFLKEPNYLEILGVSHKELQHSNFLAWMLDPNGSHKVGSYFFKSFINLLEISPNDKIRMNLSSLENTIVHREYKNIDILIINKDLNFTICIENKIYAGKSGENQLVEYYTRVENKWPSCKNHSNYFVYLTPYPRDLTEEEGKCGYINIVYREILDIIEDTLKSRYVSKEAEPLIINYINNLKKNIMGESEETLLAKEIYRKHKDAINFIVNNKPNLGDLFKKINFFFKESEKYENLTPSDKNIIRFLPKELLTYFDYEKSWGDSNYKTAFSLEVFCEKDRIWVKFCFGNIWGDDKDIKQKKKDELFSKMKNFQSLNSISTQSKSASKWVSVANYNIMTTTEEVIFEHEDLYLAFIEKFEKFEHEILDKWIEEVKEKITKI